MIGFQRRFDPTFSALKARAAAGEIGEPEMLVITSRDPGAPPIDYIKRSGGIFKDMLIHDFDMFRWMLDDDADTLHATGSCLSDPAIAQAGDIDSTAVTIRTKRGRLCQINTARRAAYGYDQRFELLGSSGMLQAGNVRPTQVTAYSRTAVSSDVPEAFFLERYRIAYALEIAHFFEAIEQARRFARRSRTDSRRWNSPRRQRSRGANRESSGWARCESARGPADRDPGILRGASRGVGRRLGRGAGGLRSRTRAAGAVTPVGCACRAIRIGTRRRRRGPRTVSHFSGARPHFSRWQHAERRAVRRELVSEVRRAGPDLHERN
jgi:hypothetical protein